MTQVTSAANSLTMYLSKVVFTIIAEMGFNRETGDLWEFWSQNRPEIGRRLNEIEPTLAQITEAQMRWKSPVGKEAQIAVRTFFEEFQNRLDALRQDAVRRGDLLGTTIKKEDRTLDLRKCTFIVGGKKYDLSEFQKETNAQVYPHANASGVDLNGIRLTDCTVSLACLTYTNFDNSFLANVEFRDSRLNQASIRNARLGRIRFPSGSMACADVSGTFLNVVQLDDRTVSRAL